MRNHQLIILFLVVLSFHSTCIKKELEPQNNFKIATSIFPIYDIVNQLTGKSEDTFFLVPAGANPHIYEPTPSDARHLEAVDLFIGVHPEFDGWIKDYLPERAEILFLMEALENIDDSNPEIHHGKTNTENKPHAHLENPHIWLSVKKVKVLCQWLIQELIRLNMKNMDVYQKQGLIYQAALDSLDQKIQSQFGGLQNRRFIQWHPAWDYFAEDYDLEIIGTIEKGHGDTPSVQRFNKLIQKAKQFQTNLVVIGLHIENQSAKALEREINGQLVYLDSIGDPKDPERNSYIKLMLINAKKLFKGLSD